MLKPGLPIRPYARCTAARIDYQRPPRPSTVMLEALLHEHRHLLVRCARPYFGSRRADAEDLVQDLCISVLEGDFMISADLIQAWQDITDELHARAKALRPRT